MSKVLIIDDDEKLCGLLTSFIQAGGNDASFVLTLREGLGRAADGIYDVVFLDVRMPDGNGLEALPKIRQMPSSPEIIVMTGLGYADDAKTAIMNGAWDYVEKPLFLDSTNLVLSRAFQHRQVKKERTPIIQDNMGIVGSSVPVRDCLDLLVQAADSEASVLITGETGTGKELFAWAIHRNSRRANKNFVVVDCAALCETLAESALFGHERGAFTGADRARDGLIAEADGGTLFLDEVGELSLSMQKIFLRVLQEHCFRPLGSKNEMKSNFRLVVATNRDLDQMVKNGDFRADLLYRLRALNICLPPLRERTEDIEELARHHVAKVCKRQNTVVKSFAPDFLEALKSYDWPGNIRELFSLLESAIAVAGDETMLVPHHLSGRLRIGFAQGLLGRGKEKSENAPRTTPDGNLLNLPLLKEIRTAAANDAEEQYLKNLLLLARGDIRKSCRVAGLSRPRLYSLLSKYRILPRRTS